MDKPLSLDLPELDPLLFDDWTIRHESFHGETSWRQSTLMSRGGEIASLPQRALDDFRLRDDQQRLDLLFHAPDLYARLRAAVMALRSYQYGNAAPDLAEEIADAGQRALKLAAGERD